MTIIEKDNVNSVEEERQFFASFFKIPFMMTIVFILLAYLTESAAPAYMAIFPGILTVGSIYMRDSAVRLLKNEFDEFRTKTDLVRKRISYKKTDFVQKHGFRTKKRISYKKTNFVPIPLFVRNPFSVQNSSFCFWYEIRFSYEIRRTLKKHFINYKKTNSGRKTGNASHLFFMFKADRKQH